MADFNEIRKQLSAIRGKKNAAGKALLVAKEKLSRISREQDQLKRNFDPNNQDHISRKNRLAAQLSEAQAELERSKGALKSDKENEIGILDQFNPFSDPRRQIGMMSDVFPFLLLPVRIETRFKTLVGDGLTRDELWIRIFPDDCAIDSFEELLSETEIKNARFYWSQIWQARGAEDLERGAWRSLVSNHGSGRSTYIISQYLPVNKTDQPPNSDPADLILVIPTEEIPALIEKNALINYWKEAWKVSGNKAGEKAAFDDLVAAVGAGASELLKNYAPSNFASLPTPPKTRNDAVVEVVFIQFPHSRETISKQQAWSQAPHVDVMPDRFVITGYQNNEKAFEVVGNPIPFPLLVGPDPSAEKGSQFSKDANGDMVVGEEIRWMVDFELAIKNGLGFKVSINRSQAERGFSRIIALGVRLSADEKEGQQLLESLIDHHRLGTKGFSIVNQGTPTNNTEEQGAGHKTSDDADESFDEIKKGKLFEPVTDWFMKKDGQWLAESLGINYSTLYHVHNSGHSDQSEGRFMNTALWPATLGYMMETMMKPVFDTNDINSTREFFTKYISGRGMVPAIKIGKQPYGILPTTAFSKIKWIRQGVEHSVRDEFATMRSFLARLYAILKKIDEDWTPLLDLVPHIAAKGKDAHQSLLRSVGLNAGSVEYYQRTAESREDLYNRFNIMGFGPHILGILIAEVYTMTGRQVLNNLGYTESAIPDILDKFFLQSQNLLKGPIIDDRPLSETEIIRKYTPDPGSKNYIEWLINAVQTSHNALRNQDGFIDDKPPTALLYLMLHHALDLSYVEISVRLFQKADLLTAEQVLAAKVEPPFLHIQQEAKTTESKWQYLYSKAQAVTGDAELLVGDYIPRIIKTEVASEYMNRQLIALEQLKNIPTARLERAFAEHIDCCSYRLDAWKSGIINFLLSEMRRYETSAEDKYRKGIYIGAFGWLEDVKSENKNLSPVEISDKELFDIFIKDQEIPLVKDDKNGGYVMTPSLNHAVTAAILRNGYMSNNNPEALRVNLSSERVRKMLSILEGIRGGQTLGALLGYYLERGLHDGHPGIELDFFIYQIRKAFPLVANKMKDTVVDGSAEVVEERNVIDGLALIEHINKTGLPGYPFGITFLEPVDDISQATAINEEIQKIMDLNDAVADVAIAESVHQIVQGNYDRGAATLDTYSKGNFPPLPDVIQTPRSGMNLTHRVGLHFETGLDPSLGLTARAQAEPAVNKWLAGVLPLTSKIICSVSYGSIIDQAISAQDLGLQHIDLLYLVDTDQDQSMKEIDDRIMKFILDKPAVRPDTVISVNYMRQVHNKYNFFELAPLLNSLRSILLRSRPLNPNDLIRANDSKTIENSLQSLDVSRVELRYTSLNTLLTTTLANYKTAIGALVDDVVANRDQILLQADQLMADMIAILFEMSKSGIPGSGFGFIYDRKKDLYKSLIGKIAELVTRWDEKIIAFDDLIHEYDTLPGSATVEEELEILKAAKRQISTIADTVFPPDPDNYKNDILLLKGDFIAKQNQFKGLHSTTTQSLSTLLSSIKAQLPISDLDLVPLTLTDTEDNMVLFVSELAAKANFVYSDLESRLTKAKAAIDESKLVTENKKQVDLVLEAAKQLFHEDFKLVPEFILPTERAEEFSKSFDALDELLDHSINVEKNEFPVDDWLYGVARVREKMQHWENLAILADAFEMTGPGLHPVQLPFAENDSWLALSYPSAYQIESERLLYTAHFPVGFNKSGKQCGILIDEWTEIVPSRKETIGVTFHYDRPSTEPPQVMLLALPTEFKGAWEWDDLMATLNETLDMAKKRAIAPEQVDTSSYARFLPAIVSSMTVHPITSGLNMAINNRVHETL